MSEFTPEQLEAARSVCDIMSDLIDELEEREWSGQIYHRGEYEQGCSNCSALYGTEHESDCKLAALLKEARAFLRVERELEE